MVHTHDFEVNDVDDWEKLGHSVHWGPIPKLYNGFSGDRFTHRERTVEVKVEQRSLCYYVAFAIEVYSSFESLTCGHSVAKYPHQSIAVKMADNRLQSTTWMGWQVGSRNERHR